MTLTPGALLGPYEILTPLGSGGMGEVYRARDRRLDRQVAVKVLPEELTGSAHALERFQREARAASALNHPNICTVHDVGETSEHRQFIVMELLEGETLQQRLLRGPLDVGPLLEFGLSLVDALAAAHGAGIVHRDIKPGNIFLVMRAARAVVPKILDFGLAKVAADAAAAGATALDTYTGSAITDPGSTVGTVAYMSPEQLRGEHLDVRTDLFSIGLVLYEMATGRPTFSGTTSAVVAAAILHQEPVPPRQLRADLPARLEDILLKALEKDREVRYQTASDLRADLRRAKRELDSRHGQSSADVPDGGTASASTPALMTTSAAAPSAQLKAESSDAQVVAALVKRHRGGLALAAAAVAIAVLAGWYYVLRQGDRDSAPAAPGSTLFQNVELTPLTTNGNAAMPAIAPDGKYVAYIQRDSSGTSLWIRQTATTSDVPIVAAQPGVELLGATVTPDSNFVDYLRTEGNGLRSLWRVPFLGGPPKKLIDHISSLPGWSWDGRQMAFVRGGNTLVVADGDGGNERVVYTATAPDRPRFNPNAFVRPAWSPDDQVIAVIAVDDQRGGARGLIAFVNVADGSLLQIADVSGVWGLSWLDSSSLVLSRAGGPSQPSQLWRLPYPQGEPSRLTNDLSSYRGVSLTRDGHTLVTARTDIHVGIWIGDAAARDGVELAPVPSSPVIDWYGLAWTANRLVHPTFSRGRQVLSIRSPDGAATEEFGLATMWLTASPDGQTLVYASQEFSALGTLWRVGIDGREPVQLVPDNSRHPVITSDNQSVLYSSNAGTGTMSLWRVPIAGGTPTQVVKGPIANTGSDISPDGRSLVFISVEDPKRPMVVICDLPACSTRRTLPAPAVTRLRWTPDGLGIAYVGPGSNLWVLPLDSTPARQLTRFTDGRTILDFAWSRDGKRLAAARATVKDDIVTFSGLQPGK